MRARRVAAGVVLSLLAGLPLVGPGVGAQPPPTPGAAAEDGTLPSLDAGVADGVEVVSARTLTSKTFATSEAGVYRTETYEQPVHRIDDDGAMVDIDPTLQPSDRGRLVPESTDANLSIAERASDKRLGEVHVDEDMSVAFSLDRATGARAERDGNVVRFDDALKGADLELEATNSGIKETIVLESPDAGNRFTFPLALRGLTARLADDGGVVLVDESGDTRAQIPPGWMEDSASPSVVSTGVRYELVSAARGGTALVVSVDEAWLRSPERVFPVRVDPTITVAADVDTYLYQPFGDPSQAANASSSQLRIGKGTWLNRAWIHFDVDADFFADKFVRRAELYVFQQDGGTGATCNTTNDADVQMDVHKVTADWTDPVLEYWSAQPTYDSSPVATSSLTRTSTCPGWIQTTTPDINGGTQTTGAPLITNTFREWVTTPSSNHGLLFKASSSAEANAKSLRVVVSNDNSISGYRPHLSVYWSLKVGGVYRSSTGRWYLPVESAAPYDPLSPEVLRWGVANDVPVYGEWIDGEPGVGVWRKGADATSSGFHVRGIEPVMVTDLLPTESTVASVMPAPADYDGDGVLDPAIVGSDGTWAWRRSSDGAVATNSALTTPQAGDLPVPADYDGDGDADPKIYRPPASGGQGRWYEAGGSYVGYGQYGDLPVPGNYQGAAGTAARLALFRPASGATPSKYLIYGQLGYDMSTATGTIPVPFDHDGDGKLDPGLFQPSDGTTYYRESSTAAFWTSGAVTSASSDDVPVHESAANQLAGGYRTDSPATSAQVTVYGDGDWRGHTSASTTDTGETLATVDADLAFPAGTSAMFPDRSLGGRIAIGSIPQTGSQLRLTQDEMTFGSFDPVVEDDGYGNPGPEFHTTGVLSVADEEEITGGADVSDMCRATGSDGADTMIGLSSFQAKDSSGDTFPTMLSIDDATLASTDSTWSADGSLTADDLHDANAAVPGVELAFPWKGIQHVDLAPTPTGGTFTISIDSDGDGIDDDPASDAITYQTTNLLQLINDVTGALEALDYTTGTAVGDDNVSAIPSGSGIDVRFTGPFAGIKAPKVWVDPAGLTASGTVVATTTYEDDYYSNGSFAECDRLPTGDLAITQYVYNIDPIQALVAWLNNDDFGGASGTPREPETQAEWEAILTNQHLSGRVIVLSAEGDLKGVLQIPNLWNDDESPLLVAPRDVRVDPSSTDEDDQRFVVIYDVKSVEASVSGGMLQAAVENYDTFALQEFRFDATADADEAITAVSEPIAPAALDATTHQRYNVTAFSPTGDLFAAVSSCNVFGCFPSERVDVFTAAKRADSSYAPTTVTWTYGTTSPLSTPSAIPTVTDTGYKNTRAIDFDPARSRLYVTDISGHLRRFDWNPSSSQLTATSTDAHIDLGDDALRETATCQYLGSPIGAYCANEMWIAKGVLDPANDTYYVLFQGLGSFKVLPATGGQYYVARGLTVTDGPYTSSTDAQNQATYRQTTTAAVAENQYLFAVDLQQLD